MEHIEKVTVKKLNFVQHVSVIFVRIITVEKTNMTATLKIVQVNQVLLIILTLNIS